MTNPLITALLLSLAETHPASCPIQVDSVYQYGLELKVALHNKADDPVRLTTLHVTYADALGTYHEETFRYSVLVQPNQALVLATPPLKGGVVDWKTAAASASCHPVTD